MRTGRLSISRGLKAGEDVPPRAAPRLAVVGGAAAALPVPERTPPLAPPEPAAPEPAAPLSPDYHLVHDRLTALERLMRLREAEALSPEEFEAEKRLVLGLPADELVLRAALAAEAAHAGHPAQPLRGPSLLGRLLGWRMIPAGLVAGLGLSYFAQPRETLRFFEAIGRALGF